jgi:60 kDa SS-A/Ro ribonucleoprotein
MANYAQHVSMTKTPQKQKARPDQVENSAGGFVFALDC